MNILCTPGRGRRALHEQRARAANYASRCYSSAGHFLRASAIPIVMLITLMPAPVLSFNQDEFCFAVTDIASRMNARKANGWIAAPAMTA